MGVGFIRGLGIAGSIMSPYAVEFFEGINIKPLIPLGIVGCLTMILITFLKETKDIPLDDQIQE